MWYQTLSICLRRTQDLASFNDPFCVQCYDEDDLQRSHLDREECFEENAVTEEEFDGLAVTESRHCREFVSG